MGNKISKEVKLTSRDYFKRHFELIDAFLPVKLTSKEQDVLAAFLSLKGDLYDDMFSALSRKKVMEQLNLSSGGLGNYIKQLKDKGAITRKQGRTFIIPQLVPDLKEQSYYFKLVNYA